MTEINEVFDIGHPRRNVFKVPDGYFEQLADRVMDQLPQEEHRAKVWFMRPWLYAAVVAGVVAVGATLLANRATTDEQLASNAYSETYVDEAADYAMVDNQDIYAYLLADI